MRTLVTGATGFLGSHLTRLLVQRGLRVRVLARPASRLDAIAGVPCEIVQGDLRDTASLACAVQGVSLVFHAAADYRLSARDPRAVYESNVTGTRNLLDSRSGRAIRALRGGAGAAASFGVHIPRARMLAFLYAAMLAGGQCIPVRLPQAARMVWHKLYSSTQRAGSREKASKDRQQAATLAAILVDDQPGTLEQGWRAAPRAMRQPIQPWPTRPCANSSCPRTFARSPTLGVWRTRGVR